MPSLSDIFKLPSRPPVRVEEAMREIERAVVAEHSHGNILLQMGLYKTRSDQDADCDEALAYAFD